MTSRSSARSVAKFDAEKRMVRRREREHEHQAKWGNQVEYYKSWEKANNKFEEWTSPRYYETHNKMIEALRKDREHKEKLEKRRDRLRKLLAEEERSYSVELMVRSRHKHLREAGDAVPTEVLKNVQLGLKVAEEDQNRHKAELALYQRWRDNNPVLREYARTRSCKDLKLSWLDQQVEKQLEKEKLEDECRKMIVERNKRLEEEKEMEEQLRRANQEKNEQLRLDLEKQMEELKLQQKRSEDLQRQEDEEARRLLKLAELEDRQKAEAKWKAERELALDNLKQHKLKLQQKASDVQDNLDRERELVRALLESELADRMEDEAKKQEVKQTMREFLKFARDQQELEKQRQKYFSFVFDSEVKLVYEKQQQVWAEEQKARESLLKDVMRAVRQQIDEKIERNREKQREILEERQNLLKRVEEYDRDMRKLKQEEEHRKREWKRSIEEQIRQKEAEEKMAKMLEQKRIDLELDQARKEEERLRREIMELQKRQGPVKHVRSRILF